LEYTTNTMNYTLNTPKCIGKNSNTLVSFKIHLSIIKNTLFYVLIYIRIPSKYIRVPSKSLTYFCHILQYHCYTPISFHILPYTLKLSWDLSILHLFVLSLILFFETVLAPHYSIKMSYTCHDIFVEIQKSSIFHKFHISSWLIKYLNPKLISRDSINTYWTYICR
jgi:hypothetical protein